MLSNLPSPNIYVDPSDGILTMGKEKLEDPVIPATPDNMCCLDGCKHYCDFLTASQDIGSGQPLDLEKDDLGGGKELKRYCKYFATSDELLELSEGAVYACGAFTPKWWNLNAWRRKRRNTQIINRARSLIAQKSQEAADREAGKLTMEQKTEEL
jgi:hypothetical protein